MRKGENASKEKLIKIKACSHRIIIPLYIPREENYYKDAYRIFEMCLLSVKKTSVSPLKVSVISNGSCETINSKLLVLQEKGSIDELIIEKENIGKINSILKALRTAQERLITITDADVLFVNGWEREVVNIFNVFPKAGMVSPVPIFRTHLRLTSNIWMKYLFSKQLKFRAVKNPEAMTFYANSIGWSRLDLKFKDVIATLKSKSNVIAVVGNSHFVGTYKREVFNKLPKSDNKFKLGGDSEYLYTDLPVLKYGGYRLSTYNNYAYHIGNTLEPWMNEIYNNLEVQVKVFNSFESIKYLKANELNYILSEKFFKKFFKLNFLKIIIFRFKGLNKEQVKDY